MTTTVEIQPRLERLCRRALLGDGMVVALTGAGVSAESGIPTFRGEDGYWRVGSRNYHPQEMATRAAFSEMPGEVWSWYLERIRTCRKARPNPAHEALAGLARSLGERFLLITQNVDGLHLAAGSPPESTYEIHGNLRRMRCFAECTDTVVGVPESVIESGSVESPALRCTRCGDHMRPHVLWFDECYDEARFRWDSSLRAASSAGLLLIVGTTGTTSLPAHIAERAAARDIAFIVVGPEPTSFTEMARRLPHGLFLEGAATEWVPRVAGALVSP